MSDNKAAQQIIDYIRGVILKDPSAAIAPDTPLVSSGLVDSFSLVSVLGELERATAMRIPAGRVSPEDMETVAMMLETARRVGRPRT